MFFSQIKLTCSETCTVDQTMLAISTYNRRFEECDSTVEHIEADNKSCIQTFPLQFEVELCLFSLLPLTKKTLMLFLDYVIKRSDLSLFNYLISFCFLIAKIVLIG